MLFLERESKYIKIKANKKQSMFPVKKINNNSKRNKKHESYKS